MQSARCLGETKFFNQCPRYVIFDKEGGLCFCWEHKNQERYVAEEVLAREELKEEVDDWAPIGAFITNQEETLQKSLSTKRLLELAEDEQNVHTPEVQLGVNGAIKRLRTWAGSIKIQKNLPDVIHSSIKGGLSDLQMEALEHLYHCYQWNDDTKMFGVTYPQLATWVWARVNRGSEIDELLRERFFEEVLESKGQCLNGNMARLMNVFSALDLEMSPQQSKMSREEMQEKISLLIQSKSQDCLNEVKKLLLEAQVYGKEAQEWIDAVFERIQES